MIKSDLLTPIVLKLYVFLLLAPNQSYGGAKLKTSPHRTPTTEKVPSLETSISSSKYAPFRPFFKARRSLANQKEGNDTKDGKHESEEIYLKTNGMCTLRLKNGSRNLRRKKSNNCLSIDT